MLVFSTNISLLKWERIGIFSREVLLYKLLSQKGINVKFLTYGSSTDLKYSNILEDIEIMPFKRKSSQIKFTKILFYPIFNFREFKNVDIIKTNQLDGSLITWLLKLLFHKKIILRCGYIPFKILLFDYKTKKSLKNKLKLLISYVFEFISLKIADQIILTNIFEKKFVIRYFKIRQKKIVIIPNYIDTNLFQPIPLKKKKKVVLFIGSLNKYKNIENLIESFMYLEDFALHIIGAGYLKLSLVEQIKSLNLQQKVKFLGVFPNSELPKIINQYSLYILPSLTEGNPKSLLEVMSCGIPCIGTRIPGIMQLISHKKNGYLCDGDPKSISNAILDAYEDPEQDTISKNARKFIIENCSIETVLGKEYQLYKKLLK